MRERKVGLPFLSLVSSLDPRVAPPNTAADMLNVLTEDGDLNSRHGYRNLQAAQAGFTASYGLVYLHGYTTGDAEVDEYIRFENLGAGVKAQSCSPSDLGTCTQIAPPGLNASKWRGCSWRNVGYLFNRSETYPVVRHVIGDNSSWVQLKQPAAPGTALGTELIYKNDGTAGDYDQLSWAGTDAADVAVTGACTTTNLTVDSSGQLILQHSNSNIDSSFEVDLNGITAGVQNWTYNDAFAFNLSTPASYFAIAPDSIRVWFTNNDGSPKTLIPATVSIARIASNSFRVYVLAGSKARADWDNVRKIKVSYRVTTSSATAANNKLTISKVVIGCTFPGAPVTRVIGQSQHFGYGYYFSSPDLEGGIGGEKDVVNSTLSGHDPGGGLVLSGQVYGLGVFVKFTFTTSGDANVDYNRLYYRSVSDGTWRRIVSQSDASTTYTLKMSFEELEALASYTVQPFKFESCIGAFACRGWMTWLYKGGNQNVRHSRTGDPEHQASESDPLTDDEAGATFSLAPDFGDEPVGTGFQVDQAIIVPGKVGVYGQTGPRPLDLTPFRKLPAAPGCISADACCRFRDDAGNQGVAYVDTSGLGVWFARASEGDPDNWPKAIELTAAIRGQIKSFLVDGQSTLTPAPSLSDIQLVYDETEDTLLLCLGARAVELRRPSLVDGKRGWHPYRFNLGGTNVQLGTVSASPKRRVRWIRSDGKADEFRWNSSTSAYIVGSNRDGGNAMPSGYWKSQVLLSFYRRVFWAHILRAALTDRPTLQLFSSRQTSSALQVASGANKVTFDRLQQGREHQLLITLQENTGAIRGVILGESQTPLSEGAQR